MPSAAWSLIQAAASSLPPGRQPAWRYRPPYAGPGPWAGLIDAAAETGAARRTELVTGTWRDAYAGRLTASDVELGCQVIAGHVHQVLAIVTAAAAGAPPPQAGLP
jgi:hypothetical protein